MDGARRNDDGSPTASGHGSDPDSDLDRNPSPPPGEQSPSVDTIGDTVYSKHWLFATLTRLIQAVTADEPQVGREAEEAPQESDVNEELEDDVCRLWDMSTNKDVAHFLLEFHAPELLLGVIKASSSPRITEMCVGILGNMACFPEPCQVLSRSADLVQVLLLLLGDPDPPTLLETSRLLLTSLSQPEPSRRWLRAIGDSPAVRPAVCFILSSSTNDDLLLKLAEVVDRLFDLDDDLLLAWASPEGSGPEGPGAAAAALPGEARLAGPGGDETAAGAAGEAGRESGALLVPALLEATAQVRRQRGPALEVFVHIWQQLSTVEEGIRAMTAGGGEEVWRLLRAVFCRDLCQRDDPAVALLEQATALASLAATLSALLESRAGGGAVRRPSGDDNLELLCSTLRVVGHLQECTTQLGDDGGATAGRTKSACSGAAGAVDRDAELQLLEETLARLLALLLSSAARVDMEEAFRREVLDPERLTAAARILVVSHAPVVRRLADLLEKQRPPVAETLRALLQDPAE